jgi:hypothetical protein
MRQCQCKRDDTPDRAPNHSLAANAVADRPADQGAKRDGPEKHKQKDLRLADRQVEFAHQVEGVIGPDTGLIKRLREQQREQDRQRPADLAARQAMGACSGRSGAHSAGALRCHHFAPMPVADAEQHHDCHQRHDRKPLHAALPVRDHDKCGQDRPQRRAEIAAHLEQRLREAVASARSQPGDA